jgi:DNA-binding LacI/PurR family transcriptional regulator
LKKATLKDIARLANVSVATVSYVLNNVSNQSIPETTRRHIQRIAAELHYVPNLAARSLIKRRTGLVGILMNRASSDSAVPHWKRFGHASLVDELERQLTSAGYHALLLTLDADRPSADVIAERKLDAVFLVDVKDDQFYGISSKFGVGTPLILMDSLIDDPLFFQIVPDYRTAVRLALDGAISPACLVTESFNNNALLSSIRSYADLPPEAVCVAADTTDLDAFMERAAGRFKHAIITNEFLGSYVERRGHFAEISVICTNDCPEMLSETTRKITFADRPARIAFQLMKQLLNTEQEPMYNEHTVYVKVRL